MKFVKKLLLIYILLKPLYIFESGALQVADAFLILASLITVIGISIDSKTRAKIVDACKSNAHYIAFVVTTILINSFYFAYYNQSRFLVSSFYFVFNLLAIILFSTTIADRKFLNSVSTILKVNIIIQLLILALGAGRYYDIYRYMGTFNDPNQFAFYILISYFVIYSINVILGKKNFEIVYIAASIFLILQSASTGILLGLIIFLALEGVYWIAKTKLTYKLVRHMICGSGLVCIIYLSLIFIVPSLYSNQYIGIDKYFASQVIVERATDKVSRASSGQEASVWQERGYDKLVIYPKSILYGSGEGGYSRYKLAYHQGEFHSTFPAILFYYGIIPLLILSKWVWLKLKGADIRIVIAVIAIIIESMTLANYRQSLFWLLIVIAGLRAKAYLPLHAV